MRISQKQQNRIGLLVVAAWAALCFLPGIGRVALFDRDEPRFAESARQMIVRGDYVVPYFNGEPRLHKPPLAYWVMVLGYRTFGVNELGARIGSALAGVLTCLLVFWLARQAFTFRAAVLAGIITATNLQHFVIARAATADSVQLLIVTISFLGLWRIYRGDRRWGAYVMLYGGIALGGLVKGPVVLGIILLAVVGTVLMDRQWSLLRRLHAVPGLLGAAAVVALWLIPADLQTGGGFIKQGLGHHVFERAFSESFEGHGGPFFYYLLLLPIGFFPWIVALPASAWRVWVSPESRSSRAFLVAWAAAPLLMFSFLKTKLPHYALPAFPALAIIVAWGLDEALRNRRKLWRHWTGKFGAALLLPAGLALAAFLIAFPFYCRLRSLRELCLGAGLAVLVTLGLALAHLCRGRNGRLAVDLAVGASVVMLVTALVIVPGLDRLSAARKLDAGLSEVLQEEDELISLGYREPSLVFYARRRVTFLKRWEQVADRVGRAEGFVCVASHHKMELMPPELRGKLLTVGQAEAFLPSRGRWERWEFLRFSPPGATGSSQD